MLMFEKIIRGEFTFPPNPWDSISNDVKELVCGLINVYPTERMTEARALNSSLVLRHRSSYAYAASRKVLLGLPGLGETEGMHTRLGEGKS